MKAQVDIVQITPKKATEYLENLLDGQRSVRQNHVKRLTEDMKAGRFRLTCDAIVLVNGKLANGQHRMWGVVESDTTQPFILMRTDDEELYKVIDCGATRSIADTLKIGSGNQLAAIAQLVMAYRDKTLTAVSYTKRANRLRVIEFVEQNAEALTEAAQLAARMSGGYQNLIAKSACGAFYFLAKQLHGQQRVEEYLHHVYSGDLPDSICTVLRERFIKERLTLKPMYPQTGLGLFIKAFNTHFLGAKVNKFGLRMTDGEAFPTLLKPVEGVTK